MVKKSVNGDDGRTESFYDLLFKWTFYSRLSLGSRTECAYGHEIYYRMSYAFYSAVGSESNVRGIWVYLSGPFNLNRRWHRFAHLLRSLYSR
jgi:hypothetical protein